MKKFLFIILTIIPALCSCNRTNDDATAPAKITRLDSIVANFGLMPEQSRLEIVDSLAIPVHDYIFTMGTAMHGDIAASIDSLSHTAAYAKFYPEVAKSFPSTDSIEIALGFVDKQLAAHFPDITPYSYYTVISPYRQQVMMVDNNMYIALNHYLGPDHPAYAGMPDYIRVTKSPRYIPVDVAEAIISVRYPYEAEGNPTAIQRFIYDGAKAAVVKRLTGTDDIATLMGWTPQQLAVVQEAEGRIWRKMATNGIIYSTDMTMAERLVNPSPASSIISSEIPGRIGRYIGYRIVESYLSAHPDTPLSHLLTPAFYNSPSTLIDSGYNP